MTPEELIRALRAELERLACPAHRDGMKGFFREPIDPYGVRSADLKSVERIVYRELKNWPEARRNVFFTQLWKTGKMEEAVVVCHVYRRFAKSCRECEFRLFERWLDRYVNNWAHCDGIASWLLAASIANEPALIAELPAWTTSKNRWKRRAAAVAMLQEGKAGRHLTEIFDIASRLMLDEDDMVQKGVGWLLKETYPKKPREVVAFLDHWKAKAPRLTLRYAAEKMTAADRATVLKAAARGS
jgi:3-methyladenine DNA glycosylase AlkD